MANTYIVKSGDYLSKIAKEQGLPNWQELYELNKNVIGADPNKIYPGQVLSLPVKQAAAAAPAAPTAVPAAPTVPAVPTPAPAPAPVAQPAPDLEKQALQKQITDIQQQLASAQTLQKQTTQAGYVPGTPTAEEQIDFSQLGDTSKWRVALKDQYGKPMPVREFASQEQAQAEIDRIKAGELIAPSVAGVDEGEIRAAEYFTENFGIDISKILSSYQSPQKSITDIVKEVMQATQLPDAKDNMVKISKEIEDLENERDEEIAEINENPWLSEADRSRNVIKMQEKYENKINARTNQLRLYQDVYDSAKQEAQYAASLAANLYTQERDYLQGQMQWIIDLAERQAERGAKAPATIAGGELQWDAETGQYVPTGYAKPTTEPTSYREWELAGGKKGTGMSYSEWLTKKKEPTPSATERFETEASKHFINIAARFEREANAEGFVPATLYMSFRDNFVSAFPGRGAEFDEAFSYRLSPQDRKKLGIGKTTGTAEDFFNDL